MLKRLLEKLLYDPLTHFLIIGAALFILNGRLAGSQDPGANRIVIDPGQIERLRIAFAATWKRPPTRPEMEGLIESHIKEEIYYREALAMGLERDDTIIRRRLRQKMEFLSEDLTDTSEPDDETLSNYLEENGEKFVLEGRMAFRHIFFNAEQRGATADEDAKKVLRALKDGSQKENDPMLGDRFLLPREYHLTRESEIARTFGKEFAQALKTAAFETWSGPVFSSYGIHLVQVVRRTEERLPDLAEIRKVVQNEWTTEKRYKIKEEAFRKLRQRYTVEIQRPWAESGRGDAVAAQPADEVQ